MENANYPFSRTLRFCPNHNANSPVKEVIECPACVALAKPKAVQTLDMPEPDITVTELPVPNSRFRYAVMSKGECLSLHMTRASAEERAWFERVTKH